MKIEKVMANFDGKDVHIDDGEGGGGGWSDLSWPSPELGMNMKLKCSITVLQSLSLILCIMA